MSGSDGGVRFWRLETGPHIIDIWHNAFYETFPARKARRLARRLEIHFTPEHGSWRNMAEIEQSVMAKQCLSIRIPTVEAMRRETTAWCSFNGSVLEAGYRTLKIGATVNCHPKKIV